MGDKLTFVPGQPAWADLGTPDLGAATRFYGQLLGWTVESGGPDAGGYAMGKLDGDDVAGFGPQQGGGKPYWTPYFATPDTDATAAAVKDAGGQVMVPPMDIFSVGRMAMFTDPEGATFSVWEAKDHHGADRIQAPGAITWFEHYTRDATATRSFYESVFAWTCKESSIGGGNYTEFRPVGLDRDFGGIMQMGAEFPQEVPAHWLVYFGTNDCDASAAKATELGGKVVHGPQDISGVGRFVVLEDPQGAVFALVSWGA
ncbi:MAG TPA: VOC family protein [Actinomycetota bacterium]|nr:VOC family protein [Actinomycetota bacterium]